MLEDGTEGAGRTAPSSGSTPEDHTVREHGQRRSLPLLTSMVAPVMYSLTGLATTAMIWAARLLVAYRWRSRLFWA